MKNIKAAAILLSGLLCLPLSGCEMPFGTESSEAGIDHSARRYDTAAVKEHAAALQEMWSDSGRRADMEAEIEYLLNAVDEAYEVQLLSEIESDADWKNDDLYSLRNETYEDYTVTRRIAGWCFANGASKSALPELFEPYVDQNKDYYLLNSLSRVIGHARGDAAGSSNLLDEYYDAASDTEASDSEINLQCADLYLQMVEPYETIEALYGTYHRDYSQAEITRVYAEIREKLVPLYDQIEDALVELEAEPQSFTESAYDILKKYAPEISERTAESVSKLFDEELYTVGRGEGVYDGSYTVAFPNRQSARMYTYLDSSFYDLVTVVHEFGHFHADWRDTTPVFLQVSDMDIAEAQSQGMEMLFTAYYPEIFGKGSAPYFELLEVCNLLDSIISGFAAGQFEIDVMNRLEDIRPEEVVALFDQHFEECSLELEMYELSHLYEQPGYYISYGVSALSALQLYSILQEDPAQARDIFDRLTQISCVSGEYSFPEAIAECGLKSCFASDTIDDTAEIIGRRIADLTES